MIILLSEGYIVSNSDINVWGETIITVMTTLWGKVAGFLPNFVAAIVILIVGYFISRALRFVLSQGLARAGFNALSTKVGVSGAMECANITMSPSDIIGKLGFWVVMLTFLVTATETLGLPRVSETLDEFVLYLPKVMAAVLILILGLFIAHFVRDVVRGSAQSIGVEYAKPLATAAHGVLFVVIISLSINQLDINTRLLDSVISIFIAAIAVAVALSLGLGTRTHASNIIAGVYARDIFKVGQHIVIDRSEGEIKSIGSLKTHIEQTDGSILIIANKHLIEKPVLVKP